MNIPSGFSSKADLHNKTVINDWKKSQVFIIFKQVLDSWQMGSVVVKGDESVFQHECI